MCCLFFLRRISGGDLSPAIFVDDLAELLDVSASVSMASVAPARLVCVICSLVEKLRIEVLSDSDVVEKIFEMDLHRHPGARGIMRLDRVQDGLMLCDDPRDASLLRQCQQTVAIHAPLPLTHHHPTSRNSTNYTIH